MDLHVSAAESAVDRRDSVLDGRHLSYRMAHTEYARRTPPYTLACRIRVGMGSGDVVPHPDSVGTCAFEAGATITASKALFF